MHSMATKNCRSLHSALDFKDVLGDIVGWILNKHSCQLCEYVFYSLSSSLHICFLLGKHFPEKAKSYNPLKKLTRKRDGAEIRFHSSSSSSSSSYSSNSCHLKTFHHMAQSSVQKISTSFVASERRLHSPKRLRHRRMTSLTCCVALISKYPSWLVPIHPSQCPMFCYTFIMMMMMMPLESSESPRLYRFIFSSPCLKFIRCSPDAYSILPMLHQLKILTNTAPCEISPFFSRVSLSSSCKMLPIIQQKSFICFSVVDPFVLVFFLRQFPVILGSISRFFLFLKKLVQPLLKMLILCDLKQYDLLCWFHQCITFYRNVFHFGIAVTYSHGRFFKLVLSERFFLDFINPVDFFATFFHKCIFSFMKRFLSHRWILNSLGASNCLADEERKHLCTEEKINKMSDVICLDRKSMKGLELVVNSSVFSSISYNCSEDLFVKRWAPLYLPDADKLHSVCCKMERCESNNCSTNHPFKQVALKGAGNHGDQLSHGNLGEGFNQGINGMNGGFSSSGGNGGDGSDPNENHFNFTRRTQPSLASYDQSIVVEFPVKHFWKIAKQQNDIESSEMGRCRGFYYRLLIHPKGTAGTDSEASHLSVFLEAVRQDWFPDDWVFPNVRFELTVVNFRDPKQSVTSWAHWSFSNDAASRGWQKMLSHSRLNRVAGFVDDEGTVLIRGKAEPPYDMLWSQTPCYKSRHLFALLPQTPSNSNFSLPSSYRSSALSSTQMEGQVTSIPSPSQDAFSTSIQSCDTHALDKDSSEYFAPWKDMRLLLKLCDQVVPALRVVLHADYLAYFVLILYFIREFRREIFIWNSCGTYSTQSAKNPLGSKVTEEKESEAKNRTEASFKEAFPQTFPIIEALQSVFAALQLYPLVETVNQFKTRESQSHDNVQCIESFIECWKQHLVSASVCMDSTTSILNTQLRQPSAKTVMCALCLSDLQKMDVLDPLPYIHSTLFTMIHRQCQITYVGHIYKEALENAQKQNEISEYLEEDMLNESHLNAQRFEESCDAQELDHALRLLFSSVSSLALRDPLCLGDYATSFVKVKHVHSMYRALEQSGRKFKRLPEVLFIYLTSQRNTKKGELFDVPLRLEMSHFLEVPEDLPPSRLTRSCKAFSNNTMRCSFLSKSDTHYSKMCHQHSTETVLLGGIKEDVVKTKLTRQKQRRRLRKQKTREQQSAGSLEIDDDPLNAPHKEVSDENASFSCHPSLDQGLLCHLAATTAPSPRADRWYCLYALIIREGDGPFGPDGASQTSRTLLLRPEEDSPWYRITQNRVEKLVSKVEFTEWKCHRDFFCAAAVYIAEDYIDAVSNGDVDLEGDLRDLNASLYHKTLNEFGVTEEQIQETLKHHFEKAQQATHAGYSPVVETSTNVECKTTTYPDTFSTKQDTEGISPNVFNMPCDTSCIPPHVPLKSCCCVADKVVPEPVLKFSPIGTKQKPEETINVAESSETSYISSAMESHELFKRHHLKSSTSSVLTVQNPCETLNSSHQLESYVPPFKFDHEDNGSRRTFSTLNFSSVWGHLTHSSFNNFSHVLRVLTRAPWSTFRDELELYCFLHHRRLVYVLREKQILYIRRAMLELLAECLTLSFYVPLFLSRGTLGQHPVFYDVSQFSNSSIFSPSYLHRNSLFRLHKKPWSEIRNQRSSTCCDPEQTCGNHQFSKNMEHSQTRRSMSECTLSKPYGEWVASQLILTLRDNLQFPLSQLMDQINLMIDTSSLTCQQESLNHTCTEWMPCSLVEPNTSSSSINQFYRLSELSMNRLASLTLELIQAAQSFVKSPEFASTFRKLFLDLDLSLQSSPYRFTRRLTSAPETRSHPYLSRDHLGSFQIKDSKWIQNLNETFSSPFQHKCIRQRRLTLLSDPDHDIKADVSTESLAGRPGYLAQAFLANNSLSFLCDLVCSAVACALNPSSGPEYFSFIHKKLDSHRLTQNIDYKIFPTGYSHYQNEMVTQGQTKRQRSKMEDHHIGVPVTFSRMPEDSCETSILKPRTLSTRLKSKQTATQQDLWKQRNNEENCRPPQNSNSLALHEACSSNVVIHQQLAYLLDPEDFMVPASAKEFYQARLANFGTVMRPSSPLMPYLRNSSLASLNGQDANSLKNLRSLDTLLDGVGLSAGFKQLVTAVRYVRISITLEQDLFGLEGFGCEQFPPVTRVLTGYRGMTAGRLYGLLRLLLLRGDHKESFTNHQHQHPSGLSHDFARQDHEDFCHSFTRLKLQTSWKGTAKDSFMLYALVQDLDSSRKGRYRYVYMLADEIIDTYCDSKRRHVDPHAPDLIVLLVMCNHLDFALSSQANCGAAQNKTKTRSSLPVIRQTPSFSTVERTGKQFPLADDTHYPLFIFKWFDHITLDLICIGAHVCDSRKRLEDYVVDWLLPLLRSKEYHKFLPSLMACNNTARDDISQYVIVEECHIRTCQNVRRFNAAIKKINKRTGDVIIVQLKHEICSPSRMMERVSSEIIAQCSALCRSNDTSYAPWMLDLWKNYQTGLAVECMVGADFGLKSTSSESAKSRLSTLLSKNQRISSHKFQEEEDTLDHVTSAPRKAWTTSRKIVSDPFMPLAHHDVSETKMDHKNNTPSCVCKTLAADNSKHSTQDVRLLHYRTHPKKKKKSKTNIPANTKSKLKAEVQVERRREVGRIQKSGEVDQVSSDCFHSIAKEEKEQQEHQEQQEQQEQLHQKSFDNLSQVLQANVLNDNALDDSSCHVLDILAAQSGDISHFVKPSSHAFVLTETSISKHESVAARPSGITYQEPVGLENGKCDLQPTDVFMSRSKKNVNLRKNFNNTLRCSPIRTPLQQTTIQTPTRRRCASTRSSSGEGAKSHENVAAENLSDRKLRSTPVNERTKINELADRSSNSHTKQEPFYTVAKAVLSTFPDGFANVIKQNCLFTFKDQIDNTPSFSSKMSFGSKRKLQDNDTDSETINEPIAPSGLENLKVLLHPSSTVSGFVEKIIEAALEEIQQVPLSIRLASDLCHGGSRGVHLSSSFRKRLTFEDNAQDSQGSSHGRQRHGENRVSIVALATTYHIDRLFNDYLRDDKQHQQKIVCEFRKQLDATIINPAAIDEKDFYQEQTDFDENKSKVVESEAHLFERSLSPRQLAALELFAAAFTSSDLIGTRKGLHSLTLNLLGKTTPSHTNVVCPSGEPLRRALLNNRPLQGLLNSHEGTRISAVSSSLSSSSSSSSSNPIVHHSTALCSLCFLFFILGAKRVLQLAESQAGRRYFDNIMTRLSDWLRRLSMIAFTEFDTLNSFKAKDESYRQYLRQQQLLRHSYWALVLVLKDVVASRSPLTSIIVSRETEAALTLATLPFLSSDSNIRNYPQAHPLPSSDHGNTESYAPLNEKHGKTKDPPATRHFVKSYNASCRRRKAGWTALAQAFVSTECENSTPLGKVSAEESHTATVSASSRGDCKTYFRERYSVALHEKNDTSDRQPLDSKPFSHSTKDLTESDESVYLDTSDGYDREEEEDDEEEVEEEDLEDDVDDDEEEEEEEDLDVPKSQTEILDDDDDEDELFEKLNEEFVETKSTQIRSHAIRHETGHTTLTRNRKPETTTSLSNRTVAPGTSSTRVLAWSPVSRLDPAKYPDLRQFLDRRTGRPRVSKDKPRIVHESPTWFVTYKPAFWHCSGPSHCVDRPLDLQRLKKGDIEKTLKHISLGDLQYSGKMESFHLWLMKQFPQQETIKRWTELECGLCHRIDLETSGAVLIARTRRTRDFLWDQFRRRNVHKEYLLLCHGRIKERFGVVKTRLLTKDYDSRSRIKSHFTQVVEEGGEDSLTEYHLCRVYRRKKWPTIIQNLCELPSTVGEYVVTTLVDNNNNSGCAEEISSHPVQSGKSIDKTSKQNKTQENSEVLFQGRWSNKRNSRKEKNLGETPLQDEKHGEPSSEQFRHKMWIDPTLTGQMTEDEEFSLCKCRIVTGRTHQIRVHMRHIGHPLVSDTKYLEPKKCQEDRQWCPRMFLHAAVLEFSDPDSPNTFVEALCPLAHELVRALDTALICVDDYEPHTMIQYGIPTRPVVTTLDPSDPSSLTLKLDKRKESSDCEKPLPHTISDECDSITHQEDITYSEERLTVDFESSVVEDSPVQASVPLSFRTQKQKNVVNPSPPALSQCLDLQTCHNHMKHSINIRDPIHLDQCLRNMINDVPIDESSCVNGSRITPLSVTPSPVPENRSRSSFFYSKFNTDS